jgi:hypothetical protein
MRAPSFRILTNSLSVAVQSELQLSHKTNPNTRACLLLLSPICVSVRGCSTTDISLRDQVLLKVGRDIAQAVSRRLPNGAPGFESRSGNVGFVVDKVALGQVFSEHFGFPCKFLLHRLFYIHHHQLSSGCWYNRTVSGRLIKWTVSPHPKKLKK